MNEYTTICIRINFVKLSVTILTVLLLSINFSRMCYVKLIFGETPGTVLISNFVTFTGVFISGAIYDACFDDTI